MPDPAPYVQPQAYDAEGNPIAPDAVGQAAASGQAFFKKGEKVYAQNQAGKLVTIAAEDVGHPGYTILTPAQLEQAYNQKQYGTGVGNIAKAGAAGAARGLTLGASDKVLTAVGGEDTRKALKGLKEANPITSIVSEIGGALAPVVLSGGGAAAVEGVEGAGLLARAGQAGSGAIRTLGAGHRVIAGVGGIVERGVARGLEALGADGATALGRIAAAGTKMAARGAAEGALYGGAQAASDSVLSGDDITAEKIVAGMGHGALFGAGLGGVLGVGGQTLGEVGAKLMPTREGLQQMAREQALKSVARGSDIRRLAGRAVGDAAEARLNATADDLLSYELKTGPLKGERVLVPGANAEELLTRISAAKEEAGARLGGLKDELSEQMAAQGANPDLGEFLRRVKDEVTAPLYASKIQGARAQARAVERQLATIVDEHATRLAAAGGDEAAMARIAAGEVPAQGPTFRELDAIRSDLRSVFQPKAPAGGGMPPPPPKSAQYLEKTERILSDYLKENAADFLAKTGNDSNAYNELNRQFSSFSKLEQIAGKNVNQSLGNRTISPSDHALGVSSFLGALSTGNVGALGAMGYGAAATFANKLLRERGNSLVADLARRASETDNLVQSAAKALAGKAERVKAPLLASAFEGEGLAQQYERTSTRVRELAQPAIAQQHVSSAVQEVAAQYPNVGAAVSRRLLSIYQQLSSKLPPSHTDVGSTLTPLAVKQRVPPVAMQKFMSEVRGALEPESVMADLSRGIVDRTAIESFKQVYPQMFQQLRTQVAEEVQQRQDELPFKRRVMLSMVFDFVGDSSLDPQRMAGLQQTAQELSAADAAKDAQMIQPPSEPKKSKAAQSFQLPSQSALTGVM